MDKLVKKWMIGGAITIGFISSLMLIPGDINPLVPMPFYILLLSWLISIGSIAVMPLTIARHMVSFPTDFPISTFYMIQFDY
jgi:hypothetical protein